jgi:hypothetical protein
LAAEEEEEQEHLSFPEEGFLEELRSSEES